MPEWLVLPAIVVACFIPGWLAVGLFGRRTRPTLVLVFAALTLGIAIMGWIALVLAEFGLFSIGRLTLIWLTSLAALSITHWRHQRHSQLTIDHSPLTILPSFLPRWIEGVFLALWLVAAVWLFFRPHEYVLGGADAGVYVSLGASIAQTGGIVIQDETLAALDPALYPAFLRPLPQNPVASSYLLPGFYVIGEPAGEITPQFYPLHPVWQAVAYSGVTALAFGREQAAERGVQAELLLAGLWALLGALAVYLAVREFAGWETAALALTGLTVSALQVWFARYPTTESFTQYLLWAGLWALAAWLGGREPRPLWALLAGLSLGELFLLRIDMIVILPVLGLLLLWLLRRRQPATGWFFIPLALLIFHSLIHAFWQSRPYAYDLFGLSLLLLRVNWWIPTIGLLAGLVFLWVIWRARPRLAGVALGYRRFALGALILVALLVAAYGWFVRPMIGETVLRQDIYSQLVVPLTEHENWRRLGWYLSPLGIWLGVAGICVLIWQVNRRTAVLLAVGALFSLLYLWNLRANPHHIYAMRRYVPAVLPFFIVAAAVFVDWLGRYSEEWGVKSGEWRVESEEWRVGSEEWGVESGEWRVGSEEWRVESGEWRVGSRQSAVGGQVSTAHRLLFTAYLARGTAVLLAIAWLVGLGWSARGFISQIDHRGLIGQLETLNQELEAGSVLIFNEQATVSLGDFVGTPLKFIYGHDVFVLRDPAALDEGVLAQMLQIWDNNGRAVYWIGDPNWLVEQGLSFDSGEFVLHSTRLESSYEHKPQAIERQEWRLLLNRITGL